MKKLIAAVLLVASIAGCSSSMPNPDTEVVVQRIEISLELDAGYCGLDGFSRFYESEKYYNFSCSNGSKIRIPK